MKHTSKDIGTLHSSPYRAGHKPGDLESQNLKDPSTRVIEPDKPIGVLQLSLTQRKTSFCKSMLIVEGQHGDSLRLLSNSQNGNVYNSSALCNAILNARFQQLLEAK